MERRAFFKALLAGGIAVALGAKELEFQRRIDALEQKLRMWEGHGLVHPRDHAKHHWQSGTDPNYYNQEDLMMAPAEFILLVGAPTLVGHGVRQQKWVFHKAGGNDTITGQIILPINIVNGALTFTIWWFNDGAGAGNVVWRIIIRETAAGDLTSVADQADTSATITASAQNIVISTVHTVAFTPGPPPRIICFLIQRYDTAGGDTLANDVGLLGLQIDYSGRS